MMNFCAVFIRCDARMDQEGENIDIYRMAGYPVGLV